MKKIFFSLVFILALMPLKAQDTKLNLVVGTYTRACESNGIYVYEFDTTSGELTFKDTPTEKVINPSFLTISEDNKFIYAVNQGAKDAKISGVSAFHFDSKTGKLDFINSEPAKDGPIHIIEDTKNVIISNYFSGSISVYGKNSDGSLTPIKQDVQHVGKSTNVKRQDAPRVHMACFSPDNKYVLVSDLGTDKLYLYEYNPDSKTEVLKLKDTVSVTAGSGPRHFQFSEDGKYLYLLQELDGALTSFSYKNGTLKKLQDNTIITPNFKGEIGSADIHISPDGKFLYASNRGTANDISIFKIAKKGKLEFVGRNNTLGEGPRNFVMDPAGNFLLVGNQNTNTIVVFKRDQKTGMLTDTGKKVEICQPVCLVFSKI